jgi:hypothetical protein
VISETDINFPGGGIPVNDAAQRFRALPGSGAGKQNGLVGLQPQGGLDWSGFQHSVAGIALLPGDKEDFLGREVAIPGIIGVAQVFHHDGTLGQVSRLRPLHLMLPGGGDGHKGRQVTVVVQEGVEFETRLGAPERRPGKKRQAETHHRGVQAVELIVELEFVSGAWARQR